ncbi:MAG: hypothetical protein Q9226_003367 [Calogaya cf. arnoldii]
MARNIHETAPSASRQKDGAQPIFFIPHDRRKASLLSLRVKPADLIKMVREKVDQVQADLADNKKPDGQQTIFHDLSTNNALIPEERTPERLAAKAWLLYLLGQSLLCLVLMLLTNLPSSQTVAHTLAVITYHIIANPDILRKLHDELASALPSDGSAPKWGKLEQLPYLSALIQEGLR